MVCAGSQTTLYSGKHIFIYLSCILGDKIRQREDMTPSPLLCEDATGAQMLTYDTDWPFISI